MKISRTVPLVKTWLAVACFVMAFLVFIDACAQVPPSSPSPSVSPSASAIPSHKQPFLDSRYIPPSAQYNGPLFKLSQDYPTQRPNRSQLPAFFKTNFQKDWRTYMMQVREYCFEGNTEVDWRVENNTVRHWYHMPWQDYGTVGREGIHGLTREAPLKPQQLAATQIDGAVAYAVGIYNEFGGYTIGQVWKDPNRPNPKVTENEGFPIGTVVCKLLFVDMPPKDIATQIPYLANPIQWQAFTINSNAKVAANTPMPTSPPINRSVNEVTLIQMDIMIRDDRAPSGWIFGTFQYNGNLSKKTATAEYNSKLANPTPWNNLVPVGLMWGNDPDYAGNSLHIPVTNAQGNWPSVVPSKTPINTDLKETVINPDAEELPVTHLGWLGRLNGPVDNPLSSCMSCHMTASYKAQDLSPLFVDPTQRPTNTADWNTWWMQWFQNVGWKNGKLEKFVIKEFGNKPLPELKDSLDFSLQLSAALQNFYLANQAETPENPMER